MNPPNVLFLITDEQRFDVVGYAGNRVVRTPNIDALAKDAVIFSNAYCPSPVCIPSRQCMAVGQYPRTCGVELYGQDLPPRSPTFARLFAECGYSTVACGNAAEWENTTLCQVRGSRLMIKEDALKYQWYWKDGPEVLFDLEKDPGEHRNFAEDAGYGPAMQRFRKRARELGFIESTSIRGG